MHTQHNLQTSWADDQLFQLARPWGLSKNDPLSSKSLAYLFISSKNASTSELFQNCELPAILIFLLYF